MDLTQMYMASPDWLKLVCLIAPWLTIYGVARLWRDVRLKAPATTRSRHVVHPLVLDQPEQPRLRFEDLPQSPEKLALPDAAEETV